MVNNASGSWCGSILAIILLKRDSWLLYKNCIVTVCVLFLFLIESCAGLKSMIMAFPSYSQLLCINAVFF